PAQRDERPVPNLGSNSRGCLGHSPRWHLQDRFRTLAQHRRRLERPRSGQQDVAREAVCRQQSRGLLERRSSEADQALAVYEREIVALYDCALLSRGASSGAGPPALVTPASTFEIPRR